MSDPVDPVALTSALVKCPSVTPEEGGALVLLEELLSGAGFRCTRIDRNGTPNLYARFGEQGPCLGFNGHTDVVPTGDPARWTRPPFSGEIADGILAAIDRAACGLWLAIHNSSRPSAKRAVAVLVSMDACKAGAMS